jgi:hypothetical protein
VKLGTISVDIPFIFIFIHIVTYLTLRTKSVSGMTYCEPYIVFTSNMSSLSSTVMLWSSSYLMMVGVRSRTFYILILRALMKGPST